MALLSSPDLVAAPCWLLATGLLLGAAWRLGRRLSPGGDVFTGVLNALVLSWAAIVIAGFALSAQGCLCSWLLLAMVGGGAAMGLVVCRVRNCGKASRISVAGAERKRCPGLQTPGHRQASAPATAPPGVALSVLRGRSHLFRMDALLQVLSANWLLKRWNGRHDRAWALAWLWFACMAAAVVVAWGLFYFPDDWDTLAYHLPLVDQWLRAGTLASTHSSSWFHPAGAELIGLWCVAPFSGDFLIHLSNLAPAAILALGTRELALRLGARGCAAHLAGLAAVTPYVVMRQLIDCENDLPVAALFVTALAHGVGAIRGQHAAARLLWALSFGLLPGVKYYALGYAVVAGIGVTLVALRWRGWRAALATAAAGLAGAAVLSGYWYARNFWLTGAPLFPQGFLGMPDLMAETYPYLRQTTLLGNRHPTLPWLLVRAAWNWLGAAHCAACLAMPLTAAWLIGSTTLRHSSRRRGGRAMLACALLASFAVFASTPFVVESRPGTFDMLRHGYLPARFLLCTATLALVAMTLCLDDFSRAIRRRARQSRGGSSIRSLSVRAVANFPLWLFALASLSQLWLARHLRAGGDPAMVIVAGTDLCLLAALGGDVVPGWAWRRLRILAIACALAGCSAAICALGSQWHQGFAQFYDILYQTRFFTKAQGESSDGERLCVLAYRTYPFLGSRRQYEVFGPVWAPSYEQLRDYALRTRPDRVVTINHEIPGPHRYDRIQSWVETHSELFEPIYADYGFKVFRWKAVAEPSFPGH